MFIKEKEKIVKWGEGHYLQCDVCFQILRRNYRSEEKYFNDLFKNKLKPIKFKIVKGYGKDKGKEIKYVVR